MLLTVNKQSCLADVAIIW